MQERRDGIAWVAFLSYTYGPTAPERGLCSYAYDVEWKSIFLIIRYHGDICDWLVNGI